MVTSGYQFQVKRTDVSEGLLELEPGEVPPEYRLFFDAPVLAAYRYASRPFDLKLTLNPLAQGDSLNQIVDRASLETRISKEGQAVTRCATSSRAGQPGFSADDTRGRSCGPPRSTAPQWFRCPTGKPA